MENITITNHIRFFRGLDLKSKIRILKELTDTLDDSMINYSESDVKQKNDEVFIDEMFGIWEDEEELTSDTVVNRTIFFN